MRRAEKSILANRSRSSAIVRERHTALWQASRVRASRPVRNLATIGGNLGRASPASDMAPPLMVHGALIHIEGPKGPRVVPVDEFHVGPGISCLAPDEIITAVQLPDSEPRTGTAHRKLGKRGGGWDNYAQHCRSANRRCHLPDDRFSGIGVRLLRLHS